MKRRARPLPGSIPDVLQIFLAEVRLYREIAPVVGVRVPGCLNAEEVDGATYLLLENLSAWRPGAEPTAPARILATMHERWQGAASDRWPWLRTPGAAGELVGDLFDKTWPTLASRSDCTPTVRAVGERLYGHVPSYERLAGASGPSTLVHGDASMLNIRTSPAGEVALLDWEDVGAAPGVTDLAWLLISSIEPAQWGETVTAYGKAAGLRDALPAVASQAILSLADTPAGSEDAVNWVRRIEAAHRWASA